MPPWNGGLLEQSTLFDMTPVPSENLIHLDSTSSAGHAGAKTDILWRNANSDVAIWLMNGTQVLSAPDLGNVPTSWTIQGASAD